MRITSRGNAEPYFYRICRPCGGLMLGVRIHFPVKIWDGMDEPLLNHKASHTRYKSVWVSIGFIFWELAFNIDYDIQPLNERTPDN